MLIKITATNIAKFHHIRRFLWDFLDKNVRTKGFYFKDSPMSAIEKSLARLFPTLFGKVETGVGEDNLVGTIEGADSTLESLF